MRFRGEIIHCETCGREISEEDDCGWEDNPLCPECSAIAYSEYINTPCGICGKKMKEDLSEPWVNCNEEYAHGKCAEKLSEKKIEEDEWIRCTDLY